jgi:hypothetical protein
MRVLIGDNPYPAHARLLRDCLRKGEEKRRLLGDEHQEMPTIMNNRALVYLSDGKYAQAEPILTKVLEIRRRVWVRSIRMHCGA